MYFGKNDMHWHEGFGLLWIGTASLQTFSQWYMHWYKGFGLLCTGTASLQTFSQWYMLAIRSSKIYVISLIEAFSSQTWHLITSASFLIRYHFSLTRTSSSQNSHACIRARIYTLYQFLERKKKNFKILYILLWILVMMFENDEAVGWICAGFSIFCCCAINPTHGKWKLTQECFCCLCLLIFCFFHS